MIAINDRYNNKLFDIPVTKECVHEEELMKGDLVRLSWTDTEYHVLDVGTNIEPFPNIKGVDGLPARFMLFSEYVPERISGGFRYQPEFQHPKMWLGYVPYVFPTMDAAGAEITKTDGPYVGQVGTLLNYICDFINNAFGFPDGARFIVVASIDTHKTISVSFNDNDVLSAIDVVAKECECEWHLDWEKRFFYFGQITLGNAPYEIVVDKNIGLPSVTRSNDKFYNAFLVFGSSRNNTRQTEHGNMPVSTPLTLDEAQYPGSIIDLRPLVENTEDERVGPKLTQILHIEEVYPHYELYLGDIIERRRYKKDENGYATNEQYSLWYVRLYRQWKEEGVVKYESFDLRDGKATLPILQMYSEGGESFVIVDLPFKKEFFTDFEDDSDVPSASLTLLYKSSRYEVSARLSHAMYDDEQLLKTAVNISQISDLTDITIGGSLVFIQGFDIGMLPEKYVSSYMVDGLVPTLAMQINESDGALPSLLGTREFELNQLTRNITFDEQFDVPNEDGETLIEGNVAYKGYTLPAGYYEIIKKEEGDNLVIPTMSTQGVYPLAPFSIGTEEAFLNNKATIYNIAMGDEAKTDAQRELATAALKHISEMYADKNNYTFPSNVVKFADKNPGLYIGQKVTLKVYGDWSFQTLSLELQTRVIKLVTHLDYPFDQEITVGNKAVMGNRAQLSEKVNSLQSDYEKWKDGYIGRSSDDVPLSEWQDYVNTRFLRKDVKDIARKIIAFLEGIELGSNGHGIDANGAAILDAITSKNFQSGEVGGAGFGMYLSPNGVSTAEVDNLIVRMKAVFAELEIKKKSFSAGDLGFSDAANKLLLVLPVDGNGGVLATNEGAVAYRCCWLMKDGDDAVTNDWHVDDQARCQTFNIKPGVYSNVSNRYYWRKVLEAGECFEYEGNEYNYIDLAASATGTYKGVDFTKGCQTGVNNDIPKAQDHVIQLGNQSDIARQNYTEIIVNGSDAPAIKQYQGINDYTLSGKLIRGDYYDPVKNTYRSVVYGDFYAGDKERSGGYAEYDKSTNTFVVKGKLEVGSTLEDGREVNDLGVRKGNLLRNSGFTGDYESEAVTSSTPVSDDTIIYSDPFDCWEQNGCSAVEDTSSASGMAAVIGTLTQTIDGGMTVGEWYIFSFRGQSGSVTMNVGGVSHVFELSGSLERYDFPFICLSNEPFSLVGNGAKVMELQLMAGNMPSEWHSAHKDNDRALASYYANEYLRNAITEASTTINGGLILSQIIKVGNYRNKVMTEETGGMSGAYNDERSPFLWGGGTMEQAIYTIMRYANNPTYQATDAEVLNNMAKFVVTHGGRAILNDIILRGYIYALGGVFNGTVYADKGVFGGLVTTNFKDVANADGTYISGTPKTYTMGKGDLSIMFNAPIATRTSPEIALEVILPTSEYYIGKEVNILSVGAIYDEGFLNSVRVKTVNAGTTQRNTYIYGIDQYQRTIGSHTITYYATNYIDFDSGVLCVVGAPYEYTTVVEGQVVTHRETMWMLKSISCRIKRNGDNGLAISDLPSSE